MIYFLYKLKVGFFMNKKTRKILVWVMLFLMVASFVASIAVYALA